MINRPIFILSILLSIVLTACNTREKKLDEITSLSIKVDSMLKINPVLTVKQRQMGEELIKEYTEYAEKFPEDSLSPQFLMRSALLYHAMPEYKLELKTFDLLVERYPESEYAPQALATAARVCEENLNDFNASQVYLEKIKNNYPQSPYAVNIDLQIEYIGDADGLLKAIMAQRGIDMDSLFSEHDSIDTMKK